MLNLGGSEAFNSIIGLMTGAVGMTYAISIGCVLWRRLFGDPLPPARWSLGKLGVPINVVALLYQAFATVISFFPLFNHPTVRQSRYICTSFTDHRAQAQSMNWGIAMFGGVAIISFATYVVRGRKMYKGPVVDIVEQE